MDDEKIIQLIRSAFDNLEIDDDFTKDTKKRMCEVSDKNDKFNICTIQQSNNSNINNSIINNIDKQKKIIRFLEPRFIANAIVILVIIAVLSGVAMNNEKLRRDIRLSGKYFTHNATSDSATPNNSTPATPSIIATPEITPFESPKPLPIGIKQFGGSKDEKFNSICSTSDGGYIIVGESDSSDGDIPGNNGYSDAIIAKFDMNGNKQWIRNYGGAEAESFGSVIQTRDGGFLVTGELAKAATDAPYIHPVVIKYDKDGNEIWTNICYEDNYELFHSVKETSDGGYVAVGSTYLFQDQGCDALIVKYDNKGNIIWHKSYTGLYFEGFSSVVETDNDEYIAVGHSSDNKDMDDSIGFTALIAKFDKNGDKIWWKNYSEQHSTCFESLTLSNGEIFVGGWSSSQSGFSNIAFIVKFDNNGNKLWVRNYSDNKLSKINSIIKTNDNSLIAIGYSYIEAEELTRQFVAKFDLEGNLIWLNVIKLDIVNKKYYTGVEISSIAQLKNGSYVACGKYTYYTSKYNNKAVIFNFDKNGVLK